jgi:hypothetical protein
MGWHDLGIWGTQCIPESCWKSRTLKICRVVVRDTVFCSPNSLWEPTQKESDDNASGDRPLVLCAQYHDRYCSYNAFPSGICPGTLSLSLKDRFLSPGGGTSSQGAAGARCLVSFPICLGFQEVWGFFFCCVHLASLSPPSQSFKLSFWKAINFTVTCSIYFNLS